MIPPLIGTNEGISSSTFKVSGVASEANEAIAVFSKGKII